MWRTCRLARPDLCQGMCQALEVMVGNMEWGGAVIRRDFLVALLFATNSTVWGGCGRGNTPSCR